MSKEIGKNKSKIMSSHSPIKINDNKKLNGVKNSNRILSRSPKNIKKYDKNNRNYVYRKNINNELELPNSNLKNHF